ncbi:WD40 repeat-like protein, partial [Meira miltonrushii]
KAYDRSWSVRPSNKSCRGVAFSTEGDSLYTLAKDGSIFRLDTETGSVVSKWDKAHSSAPSRLLPIEQNLFASGDDDGVISLWDPRRPTDSNSAVRTYTHHFDWITSMLWCTHLAPPKTPKLTKEEQEKKRLREEKKRKPQTQRERLVVTSGDGTLSVIDVRAGKSGVEVSEDQEDELLSIASVKQNSKLVVGTQLGILSLWAPTKGLLDHVDRIPGHPASVDTMCTLDDDTILTGSSDGLVRVVQILPHKLLGIVADHGGMPVERIARCGNWMASIGHGAEIKLTDLAPLLEEDGDEDD